MGLQDLSKILYQNDLPFPIFPIPLAEITAVKNDTNRIMSVEDTEHICCLLRDHYISEFRLFCEKLIKIWPKNIQNEISVMDSLPCACLPLVLIQQHLLLNNILFHHRIKLTSSTTNKLLNRHGSTKCCRLLQNIYRLQKSTDSSSWEICWNLITAGECSKRTIGHDHCV